MPTICSQVSAVNQDCLVWKDASGDWHFDLNHEWVATGYHGPTRQCQESGLYFPSLPIPPGSTIKQAFLVLRSCEVKLSEGARSQIYVELNANPATFSTLADYAARTRWVVLQHWNFDYKPWQKDVLYTSPDIGKFVQKVIDLPGWAEGNPIVFFWGDSYCRSFTIGNTERVAYSFDNKPSESVRLEITYEPPTPPPPPPPALLPIPPAPPRKGWAGLDLEYEYLDTGFKLTLHTDTPCHIWCRMTKTPPRKHALPSYRRGLYLQGDIRFCFVVYEDNEQQEPGDTLIHTFLKPDWPICETRWFYFVGTVYGDPSPTETAIFKFHFPAPPPEPPPLVVSTLYPMADDLYKQLTIWPKEPPTHWDKVRYIDDDKHVLLRVAFTRYDTYRFTDPPLWAYKHTINKITFRLRLWRNNLYARHRLRILTHATYWDSPWYSDAQYTPTWQTYDFPLNPVTSNPWTHDELKDLVAGLGMYDSGIPSGIHCGVYEIAITWNPPP